GRTGADAGRRLRRRAVGAAPQQRIPVESVGRKFVVPPSGGLRPPWTARPPEGGTTNRSEDTMTNSRFGALDRRTLLQSVCGAAGLSLTGWLDRLALCADRAARPDARRKRCILLWMDGGPSQTDTFDPKPDAAASVRGAFDAIETSVPG